MPAIAITPMFGQLMSILVKAMRAERVLEIGTLGGYSTFFFAQALGPRGQIDTIEADEEHARVAQRNLLDLDVFPFPKVYVGYALELLRDPEGPFAAPPGEREGQPKDKCGYDLVFVDANKDQYLEYFLESMRLTRAGGVIVLDNAVRQGR
jgi:predicted O-methyltransferase YrrM